MKKFLSLALVALMMLSMCITASADEANFNDSLVAWWNFEGQNTNDILKDKATKGTTSDNFTQVGDAITYADGVANIPHDIGNHLELSASKDLTNVNSMTIYMKVKISGNNTAFADFFIYNGLYRLYKVNDNYSETSAIFQALAFGTAAPNIKHQSEAVAAIVKDQWFYMALTMDIDETTKVGTSTLYLSNDGETYHKVTNTMTFTDTDLSALKTRQEDANAAIVLGKFSKQIAADRGISFSYDDLRIYNSVLDEEDLARIIPNSLDLKGDDAGDDNTGTGNDNTGTGNDNTGTGNDNTSNNPETGDTTWVFATVAAIAVMGAVVILKKRSYSVNK